MRAILTFLAVGAVACSGLASAAKLPDLRAERWVNSTPLAEALRGKVVLIDFWEYTCINWIRTSPYVKAWHRGPYPRSGDGNSVMATGGTNFKQNSGASYRQILDLSDWDKSVVTNVPGEVGDPRSPHYDDLVGDWREGRYHPLPYTRAAVEAVTTERIKLQPREPRRYN